VARESGDHDRHGQHLGGLASAQSVAFTVLAGIVVGLLVGYGLDRLLHTTPAFIVIGVFGGFGAALYAVFLKTK
jgi:F0F1-type ATP synthase assembly protein I